MKLKKEKYICTLIFYMYIIVFFFIDNIFHSGKMNMGISVLIMHLKDGTIKYTFISFLIILLIFILIKCIFRDNIKSTIIATAILVIITTISYFKFNILKLPFLPSDVFLIKNIWQITKFGLIFPSLDMCIYFLLIVLNLIVFIINTKKYYKNEKISFKNDWYRILLFIICCFSIFFLCIENDRYEKLDIRSDLENSYYWMNSNSVFFMHIGDLINIPPKEYTEQNIRKIRENIEEKDIISNNNRPNVIYIMNESYMNPNKIKIAEYNINPMEQIEKLQNEDENCKIGKNYSPVIGGGTSLTEFEALTGLSSYFLNKQIFPYTTHIKSDMNSIVRVFNNNNYKTIGIHTNTKKFYNRENIYKYLGFSNTIFSEDILNPEYKGGNISDNEFANQIINQFKQTNERKFIFGVTMQNHMPYDNKKYEKYNIEVNSRKQDENGKSVLKNYIQGIYDSNEMFLKIVNFLKNEDQPTILIMFGDHIPALPYYYEGYFKVEDFYETPYIIWSNYNCDLSKVPEMLSPSYLSISILDICQIDLPWYLKKFKQLYNTYPVINNEVVMVNNKIVHSNLISDNELINTCRILQFDLLIKKRYIDIM